MRPRQDRITLTGLSAHGRHGVFDFERERGQRFVADVVAHLDTSAAAASDDLAATVNYAELADDVVAVLGGEPSSLIETVAERIAEAALAYQPVAVVDVTVHKPEAPIEVSFSDVTVSIRRFRQNAPAQPGGCRPDYTSNPLDAAPSEPVRAIVALGANLGDALATLRSALVVLGRMPGIEIGAVSPLARTAAVGGPPGQPDYLNAVATLTTTLSARALLASAQAVEAVHDRVRQTHHGPRTLDIDLIVYGCLVASDASLTLPHPRARARAFVLAPWSRVDSHAALPGPGGGLVSTLAEAAPDREGLTWLSPDDGWLAEEVQPDA